MNNIFKKSSISKEIARKIENNQIKMHPKIYFVLKFILIVLIVLFFALFALYLISFIIFSLKVTGVWFLPKFGFGAIFIFFKSLPWLLILIAAILIIILELFVKHFSFAYRKPLIYSIAGIIILTLLGSFMISKTHLHSELFLRAGDGKLPMMGRFYKDFGSPKLSDVHYGIVSDITKDSFFLETAKGEMLTIIISPATYFDKSEDLKEGDKVVVLGKRNENSVSAFKIRKTNDQFDIPRKQQHKPVR